MPDELAPLPEEARKLALDRFRILQPHLEQSQSLRSVALAAGIPYRAAHRWLAQYRRFGLVALTRKSRVDRGERRAASVGLEQAIEGLALQKPPLPIVALYWAGAGNRSTAWVSSPQLFGRLRHRSQAACRSPHPRSRGHQGIQQHLRIGSSSGSRWTERHLAGRSYAARHSIGSSGRRVRQAMAFHGYR